MKLTSIRDLILPCLVMAIVFIAQRSQAQDNNRLIDSLKRVSLRASEDTSRVDALLELGYVYLWINADSSMFFSRSADSLARRVRDERRSIKSAIRISSCLGILGADSAALTMISQVRERAERIQDIDLITRSLTNQAALYADMGQHEFAIPLMKKALAIDQQRKDTAGVCLNYDNLGMTYLELGILDSALAYANKAYEICIRRTWTVDMMGGLLRTLGRIHQKQGDPGIAMAYYRRSIPYSEYYRDWSDLHNATLFIGELFEGSGQRDSALHYFRLSHLFAERDAGNRNELLAASNAMARVFRGANSDSTVKYLDRVVVLKDSLTKEGRVRMINNMMYTERLRDEARVAERLKEEETRQRNIRLLGITVFIITLFLLLMLLAGMKAHPKLVRFSGVLSLLLLFEFITLLIHPLVARWTHEDPVWMLLILVALAAVIVPLHHRIENWMVEALTRKGNKSK